MGATRGSLCFLFSLTTVAAQLVGCGRAAPEEIVGTTSTTSASVAAPGSAQDEALACSTPEGEATACVGTSAAAPTVAPMIVTTHTPHMKSKRSLDDAIAQRVAATEREDDQKVTPPPPSATPAPAPPPPAPAEPTARASARVAYDSHLPGAYRLQRLRMLIDGAVAYDAPSAGSVQTTPGDHVVEVIASYRINDPVFTYVGDYGVDLRSTQVIEPTATPVVFVATATPKGNATTPIGQRAGLAWRSLPDREPTARP